MQFQTYLTFDGNCRAAFEAYAALFGGSLPTMLTYGDGANGLGGPEWAPRIFHATLKVGEQELLGSDAMPGQFEPMRGFRITLALESATDARRLFDTLAVDGAIRMPLQETFWSPAFGEVTDRFGVPWMINCAG